MATLSELTLGVFADDPYAALDVDIPVSTHPHPRARIRDWIVQRLKAAALLPARISVNRITPTALSEAPVVLVYVLREDQPVEWAQSPLIYARTMRIVLHVVIAEDAAVPVGASLDDVVDAFANVFESVLLCDVNDSGQFFGEQCSACEPAELVIETENDGERVFLHAVTTFLVTYQREVGRPAGTPLRLVHADWDLAPIDGRIDATDEIQLPVSASLAGVVHVSGAFAGTVGP